MYHFSFDRMRLTSLIIMISIGFPEMLMAAQNETPTVFALRISGTEETHFVGLSVPGYSAKTKNDADNDYLFSTPDVNPSASLKQELSKKYKIWNGLQSLLFGPRIGLEANEGKPATFIEKANIFVPIVPFLAYQENGLKGFMTSAFICPRAGMELKERKIRKKEWLGLIPIAGVAVHLTMTHNSRTVVITEAVSAGILSRLLPAYEALRGKTMSEIEKSEKLKK